MAPTRAGGRILSIFTVQNKEPVEYIATVENIKSFKNPVKYIETVTGKKVEGFFIEWVDTNAVYK